jgi:pyrroloquinoline quinone biosynthesis protein D
VIAQEAHGQTVLLRLDDGGYYALDEVGATIWELCDGHRSVSEIVASLCAEFDAPEETVSADVVEFIGDLRREQLLVLDAA